MANKQTLHASVHRFNDEVAVSMPGGPTIYMHRTDARALAAAILKAAFSVKVESFAHSHCTTELTFTGRI